MDRRTWLAERRAAVAAAYDALAPAYGSADYPRDTQRAWVAKLLSLCRPGSDVLDAPCGTGDYFAQIVAAGHRVTGVDQSPGMLAQARARGLAERLEQRPLQDLEFIAAFDAGIAVDGMEHVPPEEWPEVLRRLRRALRAGGCLYLTLEEITAADIDASVASLHERGLPAVRGEVIDGDVAGYHYYPGRAQALTWLAGSGLAVLEEDYRQHDGWGYRHLLVRATP